MLAFSWSGLFENLLILLFTFVCLILILVVLIQKGRGGGLSGAFGGAGGNTAFGSKTGDVLTWATSIIFGIFLLLAIGLNWMSDYRSGQSQQSKQPTNSPEGKGPMPLSPLTPLPSTTPSSPASNPGN